MDKVNLAVFASGSGTNFEALAQKELEGKLDGTIALVICDHREAKVLERAQKYHKPAFVFELKDYKDKQAYEQAILKVLQENEIDLLVLSGYMKIVEETLLEAYPDRIVNLHPAYLPEFKGAHAIEDAFKAGVTQSGVTVHYIDEGVDTGPVILQERIEILPEWDLETFEKHVHQKEYELFYKGVNQAIQELKDEKAEEPLWKKEGDV